MRRVLKEAALSLLLAVALSLLMLGCDDSSTQVRPRALRRSISTLRRSYDPEFGVVCYWRDSAGSLSCVAAEPRDGGAL